MRLYWKKLALLGAAGLAIVTSLSAGAGVALASPPNGPRSRPLWPRSRRGLGRTPSCE
jgi:hypothetical protein